MKAAKIPLLTILTVLLLTIASLAAAWLYITIRLEMAKREGIYATPQQGIQAHIARGWNGEDIYTWRDDTQPFDPGVLDRILYTDSVISADNSFVLNTMTMTQLELDAVGLTAGDAALDPQVGQYDHLPLAVDILVHTTQRGTSCRGLTARVAFAPRSGTVLAGRQLTPHELLLQWMRIRQKGTPPSVSPRVPLGGATSTGEVAPSKREEPSSFLAVRATA